ncbi:CBO0543 family protein [Bacillus dakarensis]|uniref:CBO0543 family protein n=1 Tax=Robertmurraya dakarensis TaxID=1926278 RepID=UPI00098260F5|nr:CBO0543 family protein [Bacillus dakarensis]
MKYKHLILIIGILLLNIGMKTWRHVPKCLKSLVFVSSVNTLYYGICRRHLVWEFTPGGIHWKLLRVIHVILVTPSIVLLFLSKLPKSLYKQIVYLISWVIVASTIELMIHKQKLIQYKHGWNILWSAFIYVKMFIYSYLFPKKPYLTILLSILSSLFLVKKFKVPVGKKHRFSRRFGFLVDLFYHTKLEDWF